MPCPSHSSRFYHPLPGITQGKAIGAWRWPPAPSSAEVKERVKLYISSPSGISWPCSRVNLTFTLLHCTILVPKISPTCPSQPLVRSIPMTESTFARVWWYTGSLPANSNIWTNNLSFRTARPVSTEQCLAHYGSISVQRNRVGWDSWIYLDNLAWLPFSLIDPIPAVASTAWITLRGTEISWPQ
jgi:hypothetical protein